jgi:hypothetical protein
MNVANMTEIAMIQGLTWGWDWSVTCDRVVADRVGWRYRTNGRRPIVITSVFQTAGLVDAHHLTSNYLGHYHRMRSSYDAVEDLACARCGRFPRGRVPLDSEACGSRIRRCLE